MSKDEFVEKVIAVADYKYKLEEDVILAFEEELQFCWDNNFGPIRTVEFIAEKIF